MSTENTDVARLKQHVSRDGDVRGPYEIDTGRIIHSGAFRRMQGKTQILGPGDSDFYRTRLTHSVEVAQVAVGIVQFLRNKEKNKEYYEEFFAIDLGIIPRITAISLAHDIGHPPFGHGGEIALNYLMRNYGGFEGNAQTMRVLHTLESSCKDGGLNLTRGTLWGLLKYPASYCEVKREKDPVCQDIFDNIKIADWKPPKCYYDEDQDLIDWILMPLEHHERLLFKNVKHAGNGDLQETHKKTVYKSFDTSIMEIADDIAYGVHDLEDAIYLKFVQRDQWLDSTKDCFNTLDDDFIRILNPDKNENASTLAETLAHALFAEESWSRKEKIGLFVHALVTNVEIKEIQGFNTLKLRYNVKLKTSAQKFLECLKNFVSKKVIQNPRVQQLEYRGLRMVAELFNAYVSNPERLLPERTYRKISERGVSLHRGVADYISGMTDEHATQMYERLFVPRSGTVFHLL